MIMTKRVYFSGAAVVLFAAIVLLARTSSALANPEQRAAAAVQEVKIDNFSFGPATITVAAGTTVTWTNRDDIPHTVVSDGAFKSKAMDTDDKFSYTFAKPGTYNYFCSIHPKMTGKVVVK
jgi:plastocyanin